MEGIAVRWGALWQPLIAAAALAAATCGGPSGDACEPGAAEGCSCAGGGLGTRQCRSDGTGWTPCDCPASDGDADGDAEVDGDLDAHVDGDADEQPDGDADGLQGAGPLTYIVADTSVVAERIFDIDGDGSPDNAVADLGAEESALFALMLDAIFESSTASSAQQIVHIPWVEDRGPPTDPSVVVINARAEDLDDPEDRSDDFSGSEPFYASFRSLDACGEPLRHSGDASLVAGALDARGGTFAMGTSEGDVLIIHNAAGRGTLSTRGGPSETLLGGAVSVADLGGYYARHVSEELSMLEVLLAGGRIFGIAALPGLRPDLDLDGDGVETFETDAEGHITRCVDGDRTVVEGRTCWQDSRFADAFSMTFRLGLVPAVFAGCQPGWEDQVSGECTDPPAESLFDPL